MSNENKETFTKAARDLATASGEIAKKAAAVSGELAKKTATKSAELAKAAAKSETGKAIAAWPPKWKLGAALVVAFLAYNAFAPGAPAPSSVARAPTYGAGQSYSSARPSYSPAMPTYAPSLPVPKDPSGYGLGGDPPGGWR